MNRRIVVPGFISQKIGSFQLPRKLLVMLLAEIHSNNFEPGKRRRALDDERFFWFRVSLTDDGRRHLFVLMMDDSTSPDHLIVTDIHYDPEWDES